MLSQRVLHLWIAVGAVLVATAGLGYWLSRPDTSAWGRADGLDSEGSIAQLRGTDGCGGLEFLHIDPGAALGSSGVFVRDAGAVLSEEELARHFARATGSIRRYGPDATLPESAVATQWTRGDDAKLWLSPDDGDYAFIVGAVIEAWPRSDPLLPCTPLFES